MMKPLASSFMVYSMQIAEKLWELFSPQNLLNFIEIYEIHAIYENMERCGKNRINC